MPDDENGGEALAASAIYPIGAVVAFAGHTELDVDDAWLPCDGSAYSRTDFEALYARLGDTYGETADTFNVPDYRGRFLRGASDTIAAGATEEYATGKPNNPFHATFTNIPRVTMNAGGGSRTNAAKKAGSATIDTCTTGGDGDTRPVNVYVKHYIRAR